MSPAPVSDPRLPVARLRPGGPTPFLLEPAAGDRQALADALGAVSLRKLRFEGTLTPSGQRGWQVRARLGATAVQSCIVTLEPVTTRIDTDVTRLFLPADRLDTPEAGSETEMPDDDSVEPLGEVIDLSAIMAEALALALPAYPRKDDAALEQAQFAARDVTPMTDQDVKPFAGLAGLREKMRNGDEEG